LPATKVTLITYGISFGSLRVKEEVTSYKMQRLSINHHTISLIAHTGKIVAKILRRRIERKIEVVLGEDLFGFRRGKGISDATGMLRISERNFERDAEVCVRVCVFHRLAEGI
jgi:hypothetical protein